MDLHEPHGPVAGGLSTEQHHHHHRVACDPPLCPRLFTIYIVLKRGLAYPLTW